jgi:hypothetical protein
MSVEEYSRRSGSVVGRAFKQGPMGLSNAKAFNGPAIRPSFCAHMPHDGS